MSNIHLVFRLEKVISRLRIWTTLRKLEWATISRREETHGPIGQRDSGLNNLSNRHGQRRRNCYLRWLDLRQNLHAAVEALAHVRTRSLKSLLR